MSPQEHLIRYQMALMIVSTLLSFITLLLIITYYPPKTKMMYEESLSEGVENNISIKTNDSKGDDTPTAVKLCQICYSKKIDCIFLPCGHARFCEECATKIKDSGLPYRNKILHKLL